MSGKYPFTYEKNKALMEGKLAKDSHVSLLPNDAQKT